MLRNTIALIFLLALAKLSFGQSKELNSRIDSLLNAETSTPFHGIILVSANGETKCSKYFGIADYYKISFYQADDQFVIGSISKQITAVLILREYDKGNLQLHIPIRKYLPELQMSWADSVTIHQLLTHTHGIVKIDQPLA